LAAFHIAGRGLPAVLLYSWFLAKSYRIELRREGLFLRYGMIGTRDEVLPYRKIQDVVISRGLIERLMSLATLTIPNAMGKPQIIPGLSPEDAETLRDKLLASGN
jgi:membrane protein YdbS with pleckstrin-like domain